MTLIAGMLSRRDRPLNETACAKLAKSLARNSVDEVKVFQDDRSFFAKVDIGAFGEPGFHVDSTGAFSLMTGEPLLAHHHSPAHSNRFEDLTVLHEQLLNNNWNALAKANGTFSLVQFQPANATLTIATDKLGIRPIYFWLDEDLIVFASALRILEECPLVPKKMDLRAVTEIVGLDAPLADRTPYSGISLLKPAEVLQVTREEISRSQYFRWDEIDVSSESEAARLARVYQSFQGAISHRIRQDKATTAYLSGGLDSRCLVAALWQSEVQLHTVNFARPGTQDYFCGNQFAEKIGTIHQSLPKAQGDRVPDYSLLMANAIALLAAGSDRTPAAQHPRLVWSGEGGSVLLGSVHLSDSIVALMRSGNTEGAIDAYFDREQIHIPSKLFRPHILENARDVIKQGIREELAGLHAVDPGRNFYLYLALNDQRRKLMRHFENIDQHRLEFQLPFFDVQFVSAIMETPLDWCLRHRFYVKWLSQFPPAVTAVPWQAYPGHEPCPLPAPSGLEYQWDSTHQAIEDASRKQRVKQQAFALLQDSDFPDQILNRRNLQLAAWIHARGWRDYRYAFEAAQTFHNYSKRCGGEFVLSHN